MADQLATGIQWVVDDSTGAVTGYRRKINGVDTAFALDAEAIQSSVSGGWGVPFGDVVKYAPPVIERFTKLTDWTVSNAANVVATQKASGGVLGSTTCMNIAAGAVAGQAAFVTQDQSIDMSSQNGFWLLLRTNYRNASVGLGLTVYLAHATGLGTGLGRWSCATLPPARSVSLQPHWIPKASFTVLDGTPSFTNPVLSWRFRIDSNASDSKDIDLLGVMLGGKRPCVVISFDDGWASSYTNGHAIARTREIPLTHYLIPEVIGTALYVSAATVREMVAAGDQIGLHGSARWDTSPGRIALDYAGLMALFGDISDFDHAAFPESQTGDGYTWTVTQAELTAVGCKTARLAGSTGEPTLWGVTDPLALTSYALNNTTSLVQAKAAVDLAISSGGTVNFYGHKIDAAADALTWTTSDWTALLDYISDKRNAGLLDVKTAADWYGDGW